MKKGLLLVAFILGVGIVFILKLFQMQIVDQNSNNFSTVKRIFEYPERGYIYDRNNQLLVANQQSYDVMIIPNEVKAFDTVEFCSILKINKDYLLNRFEKAKRYSPRLPSVLISQVAKEDYALLSEKMFDYKGFYIQKRALREYPIPSAANVLGYVNEVSEELARKSDYYQQGEIVGTHGIEKQYEEILRGRKGVQFKQRDRLNKIIGPYKDGSEDQEAFPGKDIMLTIDSDLQLLGEKLMNGKRGGIVAIEPKTGEVLALVTAPSYDPNLMVGRKRSKNSVLFFGDSINNPMFDRGLQAQYAPGSPFKMINGLIGLQEGVIQPTTTFTCHGGYRYGRRPNEFMGCHCGIWNKPIALQLGLAKSCNSYFSNTYERIIEKYPNPQDGMNNWAKHVKSFGLGEYLGYDLPTGQPGLIPEADFYNRYYPSGSWRASTTISNAIGQGEVQTTPIQLANMTAAIANRGYFYTPHFLKNIDGEPNLAPKYLEKHQTTIESRHFEPVIEGMHDVFKTGTGRLVNLPELEMCGKTGTVQNYIRYKGQKIELEDHSIFVAFAPKHDPKIALAVFVENGGYGATFAAPIASLMIEKYIKGVIERQELFKITQEKTLTEQYEKQLNPELYYETGE